MVDEYNTFSGEYTAPAEEYFHSGAAEVSEAKGSSEFYEHRADPKREEKQKAAKVFKRVMMYASCALVLTVAVTRASMHGGYIWSDNDSSYEQSSDEHDSGEDCSEHEEYESSYDDLYESWKDYQLDDWYDDHSVEYPTDDADDFNP